MGVTSRVKCHSEGKKDQTKKKVMELVSSWLLVTFNYYLPVTGKRKIVNRVLRRQEINGKKEWDLLKRKQERNRATGSNEKCFSRWEDSCG